MTSQPIVSRYPLTFTYLIAVTTLILGLVVAHILKVASWL